MGIDFGSKRVGIALTDESGSMAFPYKVLENNKNLLNEVLEIYHKENVTLVVIGESKNFAQEENAIMKQVHEFVAKLVAENVDVKLYPEFMTSLQSKHDQGKNDMLDASAATLILNSYLDSTKD